MENVQYPEGIACCFYEHKEDYGTWSLKEPFGVHFKAFKIQNSDPMSLKLSVTHG